jgi:magnesium-transporting ATPase (P-type)
MVNGAPNLSAWHAQGLDDLAAALDTDLASGLAASDAAARLRAHGPNRLSPPRRQGPLRRFLAQLNQPLVLILLAAGGVTLLLREWVDGGVILGVVALNAVFGFVQEHKAEKALEGLATLTRTRALAMRDAQPQALDSEVLVPGDLVVLQAGDRVPADLRLVRASDLAVDESALTGESLPARKDPAPLPLGTPLADRGNMAFAGTLVTSGAGAGIVVETGDRTETGGLSRLVAAAQPLATPLTRKIADLSRRLLYVILALAVVTAAVGLWRGLAPFDVFMAAVALAVGAIPEGLPAAFTVTLAIGVSRMARRRAIIRRLPAVETLGSTTVICSDKTGTLTENQMTVQEVWAGGRSYPVTGLGYEPVGTLAVAGDPPEPLIECLKAGLLCNDSWLVEEGGRWLVQGDPTEGALIVSAAKAGLSVELREEFARVETLPFDSARPFMATRHADGSIYLKGACEQILARASHELTSEGLAPLDLDAAKHRIDDLASQGYRLLAFARASGASLAPAVADGVIFLGIQAMRDPPRAEAIPAIAACQRAGVAVKMITGDHAVTARAIARQIGLGGDRPLRVVTGAELSDLPEEAWGLVVEEAVVFARVAPAQKLRLVEALQRNGHVVAMTGDGVNDAPALKQADIGIAMGIAGTEVAKEAADALLTDDNFATIQAAVEEGRVVFDNLTKFIAWTLPTNLGEGLVILAAVLAGVTLPILPVQILWINMTTAILLGLMLAFEPGEAGTMERPPRDPRAPLLTFDLVGLIVIVGLVLLTGAFGLFSWEIQRGASLPEARTVAVNVFVMVQLLYLYNCRSLRLPAHRLGLFSNRWLNAGVVAMIALQLAFTYLPVMNRLFQSAPIDPAAWGRILALAAASCLLIEGLKTLRGAGSVRSDHGQAAEDLRS